MQGSHTHHLATWTHIVHCTPGKAQSGQNCGCTLKYLDVWGSFEDLTVDSTKLHAYRHNENVKGLSIWRLQENVVFGFRMLTFIKGSNLKRHLWSGVEWGSDCTSTSTDGLLGVSMRLLTEVSCCAHIKVGQQLAKFANELAKVPLVWTGNVDYYRISSIRRRGYYFILCSFSATTIRGRLLFEGGIYFFGKPADINDGWINHVRMIQRRLLNAVSSLRSLSVLLVSHGNESYNTNSPGASLVVVVRNYSHTCACAT